MKPSKKPAALPKEKKPAAPSKAKKPAAPPKAKAAAKRASTEITANPQKRQKRAATESDDSDALGTGPNGSDTEEVPAKKQSAKKTALSEGSKTQKSGAENEEGSEAEITKQSNAESRFKQGIVSDGEVDKDDKENPSDSELSDVIDEPPNKKRQKSANTESKPKAKAPKAKSPATAAVKNLSPDEAEIKRLQGWLLKCGIRKLWHKELASCDTSKAKINHLKDMLKETGMDGRYSVEKASAIKEQRELAADLEAVKEGARKWGHGSDEEEENVKDSGARPKRKAAAASRFVDFGDSGEDSD